MYLGGKELLKHVIVTFRTLLLYKMANNLADAATIASLNVQEMYFLIAEFTFFFRNPELEIIVSINLKKATNTTFLHLLVIFTKGIMMIDRAQSQ